MTSEVKKTLKDLKNKVPNIDNLTSDVMMLEGVKSVMQVTKKFIKFLRKMIPIEWKEEKMIILHKKGDLKDIKNCRPISLLSMNKKKKPTFPCVQTCSHGYYKNKWKRFLMKTNQENRLVLRKSYSTVDHLQTINQLIEKCNEFNKTLCIWDIVYGKLFDSIEYEAIFKALRTIGIN